MRGFLLGGAALALCTTMLALRAQAVEQPQASSRPSPADSGALGAGHHQLVEKIPGVGDVLYTLTVPPDYDARSPRPLVLALHPGGERMRYYGGMFVRSVVGPGVAQLQPIIVAPDCPTPAWSDPSAERAVLALLDRVGQQYAIDARRVLVVGFSMGGRGTWFFSSHHPDRFTAAIVMAGSTRGESVDALAKIPTYIIHSRQDDVVPFGPAEETARALEKLGRPVKFEALANVSHFTMGAYVPALRRAVQWVSSGWKTAAAHRP